MNIYLSGALASAIDLAAACEKYDSFAKALSEAGHAVYVPHHYTHPKRNECATPADVYRRDSGRLLQSDLVIAFLDDVSFGVGAEVALAVANDIRVIGLVMKDRRLQLSRYLEGMLQENLGSCLVSYTDLSLLLNEVLPLLPARSGLRQTATRASLTTQRASSE